MGGCCEAAGECVNDRRGYPYLHGIDLVGMEKAPRFTHILSRARQEEKALRLSGRQRKRWRKAGRRNVKKFLRDAKRQHDVILDTTGESAK